MKQTPAGVVVLSLTLGLWLFVGVAPQRVAAEPPGQGAKGESLSTAEAQGLEGARKHVTSGAAVDAPLGDHSQLLGWPAYPVTRLHEAVDEGWLHVVRYLLDHGADPAAVAASKSHHNRLRPADIALLRGHASILRLLKERGLPPIGREGSMSIELDRGAVALASLEEGRWTSLTADQTETTTAADLLIAPQQRVISGLDGVRQKFKHAGGDTKVASIAQEQLPAGHRAPASIAWTDSLQGDQLRQGMSFLTRSTTGAVFRVRLDALDEKRRTCVLRYARLSVGAPAAPLGLPPEEEPHADRRSGPAIRDALVAAIATGDRVAVHELLRRGVDTMARGAGGRTALHTAVSCDQIAIANLIVDFAMTGDAGGMPSADRFLDVHEGLLDAADAKGLTPLHLAAFQGQADMARAIVDHGASLDPTDWQGRTPLHLAAMRNHGAVVRILVEKQARVRLSDLAGNRAEDLLSDPSLIALLHDAGRRHPDPAEAAVRSLLEEVLDALRRGDRAALVRLLPQEEVTVLPAVLPPIAFTHQLMRLRIRVRDADVRVVLTLERPTPIADAFLLTISFVDAEGHGAWRIRRSGMKSHL